jgi:hypothetical protein
MMTQDAKVADNCSSWIWWCQKSNVYCLFLCFGVFCLFAGLWFLKFAIQWRWVFELASVMEQVYCCNWGDSWMNHAYHIAQDWSVLGRWWRREEVGWTINQGAQVIREVKFSFENWGCKTEICVGVYLDRKGRMPFCFVCSFSLKLSLFAML